VRDFETIAEVKSKLSISLKYRTPFL